MVQTHEKKNLDTYMKMSLVYRCGQNRVAPKLPTGQRAAHGEANFTTFGFRLHNRLPTPDPSLRNCQRHRNGTAFAHRHQLRVCMPTSRNCAHFGNRVANDITRVLAIRSCPPSCTKSLRALISLGGLLMVPLGQKFNQVARPKCDSQHECHQGRLAILMAHIRFDDLLTWLIPPYLPENVRWTRGFETRATCSKKNSAASSHESESSPGGARVPAVCPVDLLEHSRVLLHLEKKSSGMLLDRCAFNALQS